MPDSILAHLNFADPFLGAQVDTILANPVAPQPPDLRHLEFVSTGPASPAGGFSGEAAGRRQAGLTGRSPAGMLLLATVGLLLALGLAVASPLGWARRLRARVAGTATFDRVRGTLGPRFGPRWLVATAIPLAIVVAGLTGVQRLSEPRDSGLALAGSTKRVTVPASTVASLEIRSDTVVAPGPPTTGTGPAATPSGPGAAPSSTSGAPAVAGRTTVSPAPPAVLLELRGVEERIAATHTRVAAAEARVAQLAAAPQSTKNPAGQGPSVRAAVAEREDAVAAYTRSLASEYEFYRTAAGDSARSTALVAAMQALGRPDLLQSVVYNLQVVRTQLAEERALAAVAADSPTTGAALAGIPLAPGAGLRLPFNGVFTQGFGPSALGLEPPRMYRGVFYPHFHTGYDLAAPLDTPVGAGAPGVVAFAGQSLNSSGQLVGYGNYVVVAHAGGYQTLYGHLDRLLVRQGQVVAAGEPVGLEGSTGWSTGPHTHFELRHLGDAIDPVPFLSGQPLT